MAVNYTVGDQVQLMSGRPRMTISSGPRGDSEYYTCECSPARITKAPTIRREFLNRGSPRRNDPAGGGAVDAREG